MLFKPPVTNSRRFFVVKVPKKQVSRFRNPDYQDGVMAKKMSKGGKRLLSLLFHLAVLVGMVAAYDAGRAFLAAPENAEAASEATDGKTDKKTGSKPAASSKPAPNSKPTSKQVTGKLKETEAKMEERGTSMQDLMEQKKKKEKAEEEKK
jgi:hypothetical protein